MTIKTQLSRFGKLIRTIVKSPVYLLEHEERVRFLVAENVRLNQVLRELIYFNDLRLSEKTLQTKDSFDYQWREIGSGPWMPSNPEFLKTTPDTIQLWTRLPAEWFRGKKVLDAGCGLGRWTYGLLKLGAKVTAVDQSRSAVEATRNLGRDVGELEVLQQDLLNLQVPPESFDLVWSFGVAHHTENTLKTLKNITQAVKPGGYIFLMLYGTPKTKIEFDTLASYEEWRQKLLPLENDEKVRILRQHYPEDDVHGVFDAVSPTINELFTYEWIQYFLQSEGFSSIHRWQEHNHHHVIAQKNNN